MKTMRMSGIFSLKTFFNLKNMFKTFKIYLLIFFCLSGCITTKLESNDIKAIIIAMMQVALPLALGIAFIYYLILLFLTKVWL